MGGGVATERGEGEFSGLSAKPDNNGQLHLTISYTSQGFQNIFRKDEMKEHIQGYKNFETFTIFCTTYILNK